MQVMNGAEFKQKEVLIGQVGETEGFGVSDDPMLMSMLSTSLYENPLRTMIQEIMFNAWDAHRMGNCQDKPIDIYFNSTSGLIIRDYGPGIPDEDIHSIYCIYGNSTKRDDKGQTGGFGLGSKSPFAYTESFTVTSMNEGMKNMYLISRANDDNNGKPGRTTILKDIPTEESGLLVTVPFKNSQDMLLAERYLNDLLYLSGVKVNIHTESDREGQPNLVRYVESTALNKGYATDINSKGGALFAVYGGVSYRIREKEEYTNEYNFLSGLASIMGNMYVYFPPDTLTPLPNREGLNFSDKTVENIKETLCDLTHDINITLKPAFRASLEYALDIISPVGIQPQFLAYRWMGLGHSEKLSNVLDSNSSKGVKIKAPEGTDPLLWDTLISMCFTHTTHIKDFLTSEVMDGIKIKVLVKKNQEFTKYLPILRKLQKTPNKRKEGLVEDILPSQITEWNKTLKELNSLTKQKSELRIHRKMSDKWISVTGYRDGLMPRKKTKATKEVQTALGKKFTAPEPKLYHDRLWFRGTYNQEVDAVFLNKVVAIAKTVTALNDSYFKTNSVFFGNGCGVGEAYSSWSHPSGYQKRNHLSVFPAIVVHSKNSGYDIAKDFLTKEGYTVLEADEPIKKSAAPVTTSNGTVVTTTKPSKPTFPILSVDHTDWVDYTIDEVEVPEAYLSCTCSAINSYDSWKKPSNNLVRLISEKWPKTAILHNKRRESLMEKMKVPFIGDLLKIEVDRIMVNPDRLESMVLHEIADRRSNLPKKLMDLPEIQKIYGLPFIKNRDLKKLEWDVRLLKALDRVHNLVPGDHTYHRKITKFFNEIEANSSKAKTLKSFCKKTNIFSEYGLRNSIRDMKPGELLMFSQKIARLIRTI